MIRLYSKCPYFITFESLTHTLANRKKAKRRKKECAFSIISYYVTWIWPTHLFHSLTGSSLKLVRRSSGSSWTAQWWKRREHRKSREIIKFSPQNTKRKQDIFPKKWLNDLLYQYDRLRDWGDRLLSFYFLMLNRHNEKVLGISETKRRLNVSGETTTHTALRNSFRSCLPYFKY